MSESNLRLFGTLVLSKLFSFTSLVVNLTGLGLNIFITNLICPAVNLIDYSRPALLNIQKVVNVDAFVVADVTIGFPVLCNAVIVDENKLTRDICICIKC